MVQELIKVRAEKEQPPAAPLEDEAGKQFLMDALEGYMFDSPRVMGETEIFLGSLRDGRLRVVSPIKVKFTNEGKHTIAEAVELNEFGFGENPSEALADVQRAIAELYFTLDKEQGRLGTDLKKVWAILKEKIRRHDD